MLIDTERVFAEISNQDKYSDVEKLSKNLPVSKSNKSICFAAPEVYETALGFACGYDYSVDWWSLGVTIYELLSRKVSKKSQYDTFQ